MFETSPIRFAKRAATTANFGAAAGDAESSRRDGAHGRVVDQKRGTVVEQAFASRPRDFGMAAAGAAALQAPQRRPAAAPPQQGL